MDDALLQVCVTDQANAKFRGVPFQRGELLRAFGVGDRDAIALHVPAGRGRQIMIRHGESQIGAAHRPASQSKALESLGARHLMNEVAINIDEAGSIGTAFNDMRVPNLLVQRAGLDHNSLPLDPDGVRRKGEESQYFLFPAIACLQRSLN